MVYVNMWFIFVFLSLSCAISHGQSVADIKAKHQSLKKRLQVEKKRQQKMLEAAREFRPIRDQRQLAWKKIRENYVRPKTDKRLEELKKIYIEKQEKKHRAYLEKQRSYARKQEKRRAAIEELIKPLKKKAYDLEWDEDDESSL